MGKVLLSVDKGTTNIRCVVFDTAGRILSIFRRDNAPTYYPDGRVEQDPKTWEESLMSLLSEAARFANSQDDDVCSISLTGQRSTVIPLNGQGAPLHPAIMWQDTRTDEICSDLKKLESVVFRKTGMRMTSVFSAPKMKWFKDHLPDIYNKTWKMAGIQDYFILLLTGTLVTDRSLASRTNLYDLETGTWSDELIAVFGLDRHILCDIVEPGAVVGYLTQQVASITGLPSGIPIVSAGGDQQCGALGLGLLNTTTVVANIGTGAYANRLSEKPVYDPKMRLYCNVSAIPGKFITEAQMLTAGVVYKWFHEEFYPSELQQSDLFAEINAEVKTSPPAANGVILLPHFRGAASPYWNPNAKGHFCNLDLSTKRGDMARAVLEGISLDLAENVSLLRKVGSTVSTIHVSGGLTNFDEFVQIIADCLGQPVIKNHDCEATAIGAWISAAVAIGICGTYDEAYAAAVNSSDSQTFWPIPERQVIYALLRQKRKKLYRALTKKMA